MLRSAFVVFMLLVTVSIGACIVSACGGGGGGGGSSGATTTGLVSGAPEVLYTDVLSGPTSGGENNDGMYLSIFGKNFGSNLSAVQVTIGGHPVAGYRYLGPSRGRPDVQQLTVQVGSLGGAAQGTALPIEVAVGGVASNTNLTFTPNPGRMLFVSHSGNDATAVPGDINHPYRYVQNGSDGAFDVAKAGDTIVLMGTPLNGAAITSDPTPAANAWTDSYQGYFLRFINLDGTAPTGASGTGPIRLIAYPDQDVYIYVPYTGSSGMKGAITGIDTTNTYFKGGRYVTIADLHVESGGPAGVINEQIAGDHWRVVNNELTATTGASDPSDLAGGITGNGTNSYWVGNDIHDIYGGSPMEMHGIYIDGDGSYTIEYNIIDKVTDGSGFQIFVNGGNGSTSCCSGGLTFDHNIVANAAKYGMNIADGTQQGIVAYDNLVYNSGVSCLRFNTNTLQDAKIYNNTFFNCGSTYGAVDNDWTLSSKSLDMENNIFYAGSGQPYTGGSVGMGGNIGTVTNNLFFNGTGSTSWDANPVLADPLFVSASTTAPDLHLQSGSPAIGAGSTAVAPIVTTDYALTPRSPTSIDIGAYTH